MKLPFVLALLAALGGCSGLAQLGGLEAGKCLAGQLAANNPLGTPAMPATGQITFSAPAGTHAAMCVW